MYIYENLTPIYGLRYEYCYKVLNLITKIVLKLMNIIMYVVFVTEIFY